MKRTAVVLAMVVVVIAGCPGAMEPPPEQTINQSIEDLLRDRCPYRDDLSIAVAIGQIDDLRGRGGTYQEQLAINESTCSTDVCRECEDSLVEYVYFVLP